jgi:hypothetical protein
VREPVTDQIGRLVDRAGRAEHVTLTVSALAAALPGCVLVAYLNDGIDRAAFVPAIAAASFAASGTLHLLRRQHRRGRSRSAANRSS